MACEVCGRSGCRAAVGGDLKKIVVNASQTRVFRYLSPWRDLNDAADHDHMNLAQPRCTAKYQAAVNLGLV